ncbi:MAG TPA: ABC transporter permease [Vicinamibacterales bacterium]|nr:ABC transporter permease [Vicinamibacterales bacterium]
MTFKDTVSLAFRNLRQAKLRTFLTTLGVAIGIAFLAGMVSFGVGLQDQLVGRFTQSGLFDSITVTTRGLPPVLGGDGRRGRGARGGIVDTDASSSAPRLDDEAVKQLAALPNVAGVFPMLRLPLQLKFGDFSTFTAAGAVPLSASGQGAFQTITHGAFFANDTDDACMLSLDMATRMNADDPKSLIGQGVTLEYAAKTAAGGPSGSPLPSMPGVDLGGLQVRRVEYKCPIVGIVERETGPAFVGVASVSPLMLPLGKARAIYNAQVTNVQSLMRNGAEDRAYPTITVKVSSAKSTQDVEAAIKKLGFSAFSLNDLLQGAKRAFLILDIVLALIGSIALVISSLGIANTMVMSILERTREIGVMKAIGGSDGDVRKIFLIEASAIGVLGGVAGVLLGWVVGRLANFGANIYIVGQGGTAGDLFSMPFWLIASAIGFSVLLSLMAGMYPANRAARLDPIQALRHD